MFKDIISNVVKYNQVIFLLINFVEDAKYESYI